MNIKYRMTIPATGAATNFLLRPQEPLTAAMTRAAAKLGYLGGCFRQENFHMNNLVTICKPKLAHQSAYESATAIIQLL